MRWTVERAKTVRGRENLETAPSEPTLGDELSRRAVLEETPAASALVLEYQPVFGDFVPQLENLRTWRKNLAQRGRDGKIGIDGWRWPVQAY